jgi:hypothetical protein
VRKRWQRYLSGPKLPSSGNVGAAEGVVQTILCLHAVSWNSGTQYPDGKDPQKTPLSDLLPYDARG